MVLGERSIKGQDVNSIEASHNFNTQSSLGLPPRRLYSSQYLNERYSSSKAVPGLTVVENKDNDVMNWTGAMDSIRKDYIDRGTIFQNDLVVLLVPGEDGSINLDVISNGIIDLMDTTVVLAAGSWTIPLLEASSIQLPPASRSTSSYRNL